MSGYTVAELERKLANLLRIATVTDVDPANARVKVTFGGETESGWLPFAVGRAGGARIWSPPVAGEQVTVLSPGGDTTRAVVTGSLPSSNFPSPSSDGAAHVITMGSVTVTLTDDSISVEIGGTSIVATADSVAVNSARIDLN